MTIFISYARKDAPAVGTLRADLERAKRDAWHDAELTGGQAWWDTILAAIRTSEVFLIALSPDWLQSRACKSEYLYAVACGRRVLAVKVGEVRPELAPPEIANSQIIDYRERTADAAIVLVTALATLPPPAALPSPLPVPPPVPMSYLSTYREQIEAPALSFEQQHQLLFALQGELADDDDEQHDTIVGLLQQFRKRRDIVESIGRDIDTMLGASTVRAAGRRRWRRRRAGCRSGTRMVPRSPRPFRAALLGRLEVDRPRRPGRRDDGRSGRHRRRPCPNGGPGVRRSGCRRRRRGQRRRQRRRRGRERGQCWRRTLPTSVIAPNVGDAANRAIAGNAGAGVAPGSVPPFSPGAFAGLIVASIFCFGLVGVIVGWMNVKHPARKSQATALIVIGAVVIGLSVIYGLAAAAAESGGSDF